MQGWGKKWKLEKPNRVLNHFNVFSEEFSHLTFVYLSDILKALNTVPTQRLVKNELTEESSIIELMMCNNRFRIDVLLLANERNERRKKQDPKKKELESH